MDIWVNITISITITLAVVGCSALAFVKFWGKTFIEKRVNEGFERYKSQLDMNNYISRTRFDLEINVYKQLSGSIVQMVNDAWRLFPNGIEQPYQDKEKEKERLWDLYSKSLESYETASKAIMENSPFVPQKFYEMFEGIRKECMIQINWFPEFRIKKSEGFSIGAEFSQEQAKCWSRTGEISAKLNEILSEMRSHLEKLDVTDEKGKE